MEDKYRIFIAYRGGSLGECFGNDLWEYLTNDDDSYNKYGRIYFSPHTETYGNFKDDIPRVLANIEYFILPLTKEFFSDFWDEESNAPKKSSITYLEIKEALMINKVIENNKYYPGRESKEKIKFIRIDFPEYRTDINLLKRLFGDQTDIISCLKPFYYDESTSIRDISNYICKKDYKVEPMYLLTSNWIPNIYLTFKKETENQNKLSFYKRLYNVKRIKLLNYAGTSFISGVSVSKMYKPSEYLRNWFSKNLLNGNIEAIVVLTDPHSQAADDAAKYKMYPHGDRIDKDKIIKTNINALLQFRNENPETELSAYITDICLPYGIMIVEHDNEDEDYIKIDLYSPVITDDNMRPSFYLYKNNENTKKLYNFFIRNFEDVMIHNAQKIGKYIDINWLLSKKIIHRGKISMNVNEHTIEAFIECIKAGYPIEVDLLFLSDGFPIVYRDEKLNNGKMLSECSFGEFTEMASISDNKINGVQVNHILSFNDFLKLIGGNIPLLIEIKCGIYELNNEIKRIAETVFMELKTYKGKYAIHSANPFVLKAIKEFDALIPCGLISQDFSTLNVDEDIIDMHTNNKFLEVLHPDFISYNINHLPNNDIFKLCKDNTGDRIPLLGWTIRDNSGEMKAKAYCDNMIIEDGLSFM